MPAYARAPKLARVRKLIDGVPDKTQLAIRSTLQRVSNSARTVALRQFASINRIQQKALKVKRRVSRVGKQRASVFLGLRPISPLALGKPVIIGSSRGKRVSRLGGVRVANRFYRGGFLAKLKSGHTGIFQRVGRARLPIRKVTESLIGGERAAATALAHAQQRLPVVLKQQLKFRLGQQAGVADG